MEGDREEDMEDEVVVFEDKGTNGSGDRFLPSLNEEISERFNNNEGERQFVNPETGEMVGKKKKEEEEANSGSLIKINEN